MKKIFFINSLFSPFKTFKIKFYIGTVKIGVPYFCPRVWKKSKDKPGYKTPEPRKIGFDFCGLGWKTKWTDTDYRFEWNPVLSFVFFKWQLALTFIVDNPDEYWTAFLYYYFNTDKTKSKLERINQCKNEFPLICTVWSSVEKEKTVNYYNYILKEKYKDISLETKRDKKLEEILK